MKKLVIAAVALAALNTVSASSCSSAFSGFYAGLQAGMNATTGNSSMELPRGAARATKSLKGTRGSQTFIGGLFAGYGMGVGSCTYIGAEFYANFLNDKATLFNDENSGAGEKNFNVSTKNNANFGAKLRLGYTVSQQAMIFLGLGLEYAQWQIKVDNVADGVRQTGMEPTTKKTKRTLAFAPSIGMEMFMTKNIFVRGEYTFVATGALKIEPTYRVAVAPAPTQTGTIKSNINQHRFALALGYKF